MAWAGVGANDQPNGAHLIPQKKQRKSRKKSLILGRLLGKAKLEATWLEGPHRSPGVKYGKSHHFTLSHSLPLTLKEGVISCKASGQQHRLLPQGAYLLPPKPSPIGNRKLLGWGAVSSFFGSGPSIQRQESSCLSRAAQEPGAEHRGLSRLYPSSHLPWGCFWKAAAPFLTY